MQIAATSPEYRRPDLSQYLIHLTKGEGATLKEQQGSARNNLMNILRPTAGGKCQLNGAPIGLLIKAALKNDTLKKLITAVSLSETPLEYIEQLTPHYSDYGLVFTKEFIRSRNGNPAFYISTAHNDKMRKAVFDLIAVEGYETRKLAALLPFFTQFGKTSEGWGMDYHYEREWRVPNNLEFHHYDVFAGLCHSELDVDSFSSEFPEVPFICPSWSIDRKMSYLRNWKSPSDRQVIQVVQETCPYGMADMCPYHD